jgi:hypothetical protein
MGLKVSDWFHLAQERGQSCEHSHKFSGSIKQGEFRDWVRHY